MKGKKHRPEQIIRKLRETGMMIAAGRSAAGSEILCEREQHPSRKMSIA